MNEQANQRADATSVAAAMSEQVIQGHVRLKEIEIRLKSKLLAATLVGVPVCALARSQQFVLFGDQTHWIAGGLGLIAGWAMGERAVFTLIGGVITYLLMQAKAIS